MKKPKNKGKSLISNNMYNKTKRFKKEKCNNSSKIKVFDTFKGDEINDEITDKKIESLLNKYRIDISRIYEKSSEHYIKFNEFLRCLKDINIEVYDCMMYLERIYFSFKNILCALDIDNMDTLKYELLVKFKLKDPTIVKKKKNKLYKFIKN